MIMLESLLAERLTYLCAGLLLAALWWPAVRPEAPARGLRARLGRLAEKLNRTHRSVATRVYRGLILLGFSGTLALLLGFGLEWAAELASYFDLIIVLSLAYLMPVAALYSRASKVGQAVKRDQLARARGLAAAITRSDVKALDAHGLLRVSLEHLAKGWGDQVFAAAFWYLLAGLPGLCLWRLVSLLQPLMLAAAEPRPAFSWASLSLHRLMGYVPQKLAALCLAMASLVVPKLRPLAALKASPLAAMAGALQVSLQQAGGWVGSGSAKVTLADFRRGLLLYVAAYLLLLLACAAGLAVLSDIAFLPKALLGEGE